MTRRKREITGLANEQDFPHLVELALPSGGFRGSSKHVPAVPSGRASRAHPGSFRTIQVCRHDGIRTSAPEGLP
jgi:hypothetical protein